jgi:hypothetical protein
MEWSAGGGRWLNWPAGVVATMVIRRRSRPVIYSVLTLLWRFATAKAFAAHAVSLNAPKTEPNSAFFVSIVGGQSPTDRVSESERTVDCDILLPEVGYK